MTDKSWMLNARAIKAAKQCIYLVEQELDIKLRLSHPDFLELLSEYAELTGSAALNNSLRELAEFAPAKVQKDMHSPSSDSSLLDSTLKSKVVNLNRGGVMEHNSSASAPNQTSSGSIEYNGKRYPRFLGDKEFKGLYRGQPRYA